jgi:hypothetical protein
MIVGLGKTRSPAGLVERGLGRVPVPRVGMMDEDGPIGTVEVSLSVHVGFDLAEIWKDSIEVPLVVAQ